jgi:hypothetical protein
LLEWHTYAVSGKKLEAQLALSRLEEFSCHNYVSPIEFAVCYATFGNRDRAFEYLDQAYRQHETWIVTLAVNSGLDNLRSDPDFTGSSTALDSKIAVTK